MQVSVENTSSIGRRLTVQIPADRIQVAIKEKTDEMSRKAKVAGFRPGKVPKQIIEQKYGAQIREEALGKVIEKSLPEALNKEALKPAGTPVVEEVRNEPHTVKYVVSFEVFPDLPMPDLAALKVEQLEVAITEQDVDDAVEKLRAAVTNWQIVDRPAKMGDMVLIDYSSTLNGKPYENSSNKGVPVELGSGHFLAGFEEGLVHAKAGDTRELELLFPAEWRMEKLAGKAVKFIVQVKSVSERHRAELDAEFAKKIGAEGVDLEAIRRKARTNLEKQVNFQISEHAKAQALEQLLKNSGEVPLPKALVEREMSLMHEDLHRSMGDKEQGQHCHHQGLQEQAERRVTLSLLLRKVIEKENLTPDKQQVRAKIEQIAKTYGNADFVESMYYESEELVASVQNAVLADQALAFILTQATRVPRPLSVTDLFKR